MERRAETTRRNSCVCVNGDQKKKKEKKRSGSEAGIIQGL